MRYQKGLCLRSTYHMIMMTKSLLYACSRYDERLLLCNCVVCEPVQSAIGQKVSSISLGARCKWLIRWQPWKSTLHSLAFKFGIRSVSSFIPAWPISKRSVTIFAITHTSAVSMQQHCCLNKTCTFNITVLQYAVVLQLGHQYSEEHLHSSSDARGS